MNWKTGVAALALATMFVGSASAVTNVTIVNRVQNSAAGDPGTTSTIVLDGTTLSNAGFTLTGAGQFTGLSAGVAAPPYGDTTEYYAVLGGHTGTMTFSPISNIDIDFGSLDNYNTITFFSGATQVGQFTGAQIAGLASIGGQQFYPPANLRAYFSTGNSAATFDKIVFTSGANSFEFDNVATGAVPEPAVWFMMVAGFGLLGMALRSSKLATRFAGV